METLRGQLLVASPSLFDPNFRRTVVLVGEHNEEGAMGVVLNRPSEVSVEDAAPPLAALVNGDEAVFIGGPVQPEAVVVLCTLDDPETADAHVFGSVGFLHGELDETPQLEQARVFAGYAGWGPGQLEGELAEESWILEPARHEDVFSTSPESLWSEVLRRKGGSYRILASMPDDPRLN